MSQLCAIFVGSGGKLDPAAGNTLKVGELSLPSQAEFPYPGGMRSHMADYFRLQMGLIQSEVEARQVAAALAPATVQYYVMGPVGEAGAPGNEWRQAAVAMGGKVIPTPLSTFCMENH